MALAGRPDEAAGAGRSRDVDAAPHGGSGRLVEEDVPLERYAGVAAALDQRGDAGELELLEEQGLTPARWREAAAHWMTALQREVTGARLTGRGDAQARYPLAVRYGAAYARAAGELRARAAEEASPGVSATSPLPTEVAAPAHGVLAASNAAAQANAAAEANERDEAQAR